MYFTHGAFDVAMLQKQQQSCYSSMVSTLKIKPHENVSESRRRNERKINKKLFASKRGVMQRFSSQWSSDFGLWVMPPQITPRETSSLLMKLIPRFG